MNNNFIFSLYRINISAVVPSLRLNGDSKSVPITEKENTRFVYSTKDAKTKNKKSRKNK